MQIEKVHCLFEQSGTFKNEFIKLGIPAEDYDILDDFGETDHVMDLFTEIRNAYQHKESIFDGIHREDLIMSFFPCTRFEEQIQMSFRGQAKQFAKWSDQQKVEYTMKLHDELHELYELFSMMVVDVLSRDLRMVIENLWHMQHYLRKYFPIPSTIVDENRWLKGDHFVKPTQYWFIGCRPENNLVFEPVILKEKKRAGWASVAKGGVNSAVERSMIHPDYANRFIKEYLIDQIYEDS